eukprot:TRINITY_DN20669_c0_g2_i1.p1 TRINITY_DN20669_c0_g2~~TRINITY_DN20669_c0_g2_i1.p1  ORF type:complete len:555 (+),score=112.63 TRINITY_DN20669_c0_g2_i1:61-1725(+)
MEEKCGELTLETYSLLRYMLWPLEMTNDIIDFELQNWTTQGFAFSKEWMLGFHQNKNGPCGVLAAVQAEFLLDLIFLRNKWRDVEGVPSATEIEESLVNSLAKILTRAKTATIKLVLKKISSLPFSLGSNQNLVVLDVPDGMAVSVIKKYISQFRGEGGTVLFLYSLLLTRGTEMIHQDMMVGAKGTETGLIVGNWALCSQALVNLCLIGQALPEVDDDTMTRCMLTQLDVGFLTYEEVENMTFGSGFTLLSDIFKHPNYPIWVLHGGDHYTTLFSFDKSALTVGKPKVTGGDSGKCAGGCGFFGNPVTFGYCSSCWKKVQEQKNSSGERKKCEGKGCEFFGSDQYYGYCSVCWKNLPAPEQEKRKNEEKLKQQQAMNIKSFNTPYSFEMFHFNGLPPAGPLMSRFRVSKTGDDVDVSSKDLLTNIAMIIQRKWEGTEDNGNWIYEVALRNEKKSTPNTNPTPTQTEIPSTEWRCSYCVINHVFGFNPPMTTICLTCNQSIEDCGKTVWVKYEQMGVLGRRDVDTNYSPKIQSLIQTRWPSTSIQFSGKKPPTI